ncbi:ribbon-helix-helix protein, CopG family [Oceanospirillum beijerinckii]|uniref:ribbon-helix-helix protein, CopG family n=1 Tax=Oceanospirillum beijerinckii TaxID=64976 RepID=UPI000420200B|nr:ribbon-helix-helix protein, CopG family [Oceanospirillum beijerinckii]MAC45989.1 ribbon-helix-helix protein, CopG family [Oceanospirillum sp.]
MSKENTDNTESERKKNTSLRLNSKTLKALKIKAIEEETSVQKIVEQLIEDYLDGHIKLKKRK